MASVIAVLALQGAFAEHEQMLDQLGVQHVEIRELTDLDKPFDGLILPGGESTVQGRLLHELGLFEPLRQRIVEGLPVFGTCAGLLLLAKRIDNDCRCHFAVMDILARRNAYGRQLGSFSTLGMFDDGSIDESAKDPSGSPAGKEIPMTFIRAPYIEQVTGPDVAVLSTVDDKIVAVRQRNMLVTAFHPELTQDTTVHQYFLRML